MEMIGSSYEAKVVTTRKPHGCNNCGRVILKGERAGLVKFFFKDIEDPDTNPWVTQYQCTYCAREEIE